MARTKYSKYIARAKPGMKGTGILIPNHYDHHVPTWLELIAEVRKSFPTLRDSEIELRTVTNSHWCKGCPVVVFEVPTAKDVEGWRVVTNSPDVGF